MRAELALQILVAEADGESFVFRVIGAWSDHVMVPISDAEAVGRVHLSTKK